MATNCEVRIAKKPSSATASTSKQVYPEQVTKKKSEPNINIPGTLKLENVEFYQNGYALFFENDNNIPYIHIFALLDMLKQICNHPALVEGVPENYNKRQSGKWELFKEILDESLDSGHKVVIFTQYLGIVEMLKLYLTKQKISHVTLTGQSTKRGDIINKFNTDKNCKVFVGSLKAGGTGFDLIAASIVIHYDRWWNAAKEDQATDRVHRIGQTRGVQVFKFITKGTLEEKISNIIERKREILNEVIGEDSEATTKIFSREELLDLLSLPQ
jgi:SNF2 family DNA or RNA helicase